MDFLGVKIKTPDMFNSNSVIEKTRNNKDKGQRQFCGCIISKDIGEYNTCPHLCEYCYANTSKNIALTNWDLHKRSPDNETIK
jgi:biotin synthase-like enzyme